MVLRRIAGDSSAAGFDLISGADHRAGGCRRGECRERRIPHGLWAGVGGLEVVNGSIRVDRHHPAQQHSAGCLTRGFRGYLLDQWPRDQPNTGGREGEYQGVIRKACLSG